MTLPIILVPLMLFLSSVVMAFAWLGHLKFRSRPFILALLFSWFLVLPEYILNVIATRYGYGVYTGAQMASFNLCTGVLCVALVSRLFLREIMTCYQLVGFLLMAFSVILIMSD
ncbi:MAG: DMT family protein [Crocosphaera sp.]|nr:DMT family protein [Crocosphaera sp.]